jgi:putative endonuclease
MKKTRKKIIYFFYILKCKDKSLYSGVTKDLVKRALLHNQGLGSVYVKTHGGGRIIYSEKYKTLGDALRREIAVKKLTRKNKLKLLQK